MIRNKLLIVTPGAQLSCYSSNDAETNMFKAFWTYPDFPPGLVLARTIILRTIGPKEYISGQSLLIFIHGTITSLEKLPKDNYPLGQ